MSTHVLRRTLNNLDMLDRILNTSSLSTKKLTHQHIIDVGADLLSKTHVDVDAMKEAAVKQALEAEERRHTKELRAALKRLRGEMEAEKRRALDKQKQYFEDLARRVAEQRDRAEEEHIRELTRKHDKEKEEALRLQWEECERLKVAAIEEAIAVHSRKLRQEFNLEKERAISATLKEAAERYRKRELETIASTRKQVEKEAAEEAARVARIHADEMARLQHRYNLLHKRYTKEKSHRENLEEDFRGLQDDYKRFMTYTDGRYSADYMLKIRHHGMEIANKFIPPVVYQDIEDLWDKK